MKQYLLNIADSHEEHMNDFEWRLGKSLRQEADWR